MNVITPIPDDVAKFLRESNNSDTGWRAIQQACHTSQVEARHYAKVWKNQIRNGTTINSDIDDVTLTSYHDVVAQNTRIAKALDKEKAKSAVIIDACVVALSKINKNFSVRPGRTVDATANLQLHALRSDAQVGERVNPDEVQGMSEYNFDIYVQRLRRWCNKLLLFKTQDEKNLGLNKLVLTYLGDQVEGESVYKGQAFYIDQILVDQLFKSVEEEAKTILDLAASFNQIEIFAVTGNHGRVGHKGQHHAKTNWDYVFYKCLKKALEHQKNIKMYISESPAMIVQHGQRCFLYKHGDDIVSWMGLPFYGMDRNYHKIQTLYGMQVHHEVVGHFHQPSNIEDSFIINGTMVGGSNLSINKMSLSSRPSQKIFYYDDIEGINRESNLYLADVKVIEQDEKGIYTAWS
jgi:hypothetical protein